MKRERLRVIFSKAKIGIAGAGGLGSNCAVSLVRSGIRHLVIADFDRVSGPNLDRQYYFRSQVGEFKVDALSENLRRIEPEIDIAAHRTRLDPSSVCAVFPDCDIIVEAFDDVESKAMIIETVLDRFPGKHLVAASGLAGIGRFEALKIVHRGRLHLCGDFENEVSEEMPPIAPRVAIVANMEADTVLGLLLQLERGP